MSQLPEGGVLLVDASPEVWAPQSAPTVPLNIACAVERGGFGRILRPAAFALSAIIVAGSVEGCANISLNAGANTTATSISNVGSSGFDACFSAADSAYTSSWPHDDPSYTQKVVQCATDANWSDLKWDSIDYIIDHESSFRDWAVNPSSGACSLGQALPCSKLGSDHSLKAQVKWFFGYIRERYHNNPDEAATFWRANHWY